MEVFSNEPWDELRCGNDETFPSYRTARLVGPKSRLALPPKYTTAWTDNPTSNSGEKIVYESEHSLCERNEENYFWRRAKYESTLCMAPRSESPNCHSYSDLSKCCLFTLFVKAELLFTTIPSVISALTSPS